MARGGHGENATTVESKDLDGVVANVAKAIAHVQTRYCLEWAHSNRNSSKFRPGTQAKSAVPEFTDKGIIMGCKPDGGMWFTGPRSLLERLLAVAFEAKHQQDGGNANERWFKNHYFCKIVSPDMQYVTFMSGKGAVEGGVLWTHVKSVEANDPNTHFYLSVNGFTANEVFDIMIKHLKLNLTFDEVKDYIGIKPKAPKAPKAPKQPKQPKAPRTDLFLFDGTPEQEREFIKNEASHYLVLMQQKGNVSDKLMYQTWRASVGNSHANGWKIGYDRWVRQWKPKCVKATQ